MIYFSRKYQLGNKKPLTFVNGLNVIHFLKR